MRDIANRARSMMASGRVRWRSTTPDDATLIERVRAKLGRVCSHPRAVDVAASNGVVTLRGAILANEHDDVVGTIRRIRASAVSPTRCTRTTQPKGFLTTGGGNARGRLMDDRGAAELGARHAGTRGYRGNPGGGLRFRTAAAVQAETVEP